MNTISKSTIMVIMMMVFCLVISKADDVIVMRNGDLVIAKVTEITQKEVKYKKATRLDGPTYTVNKSDVLAINYEDGEKETFEEVVDNTSAQSTTANGNKHITINDLTPDEIALNSERIAYFNREINYPKVKESNIGKKSDRLLYRFFVDENSVVENKDIQISMELGMMEHTKNGSKFEKEISLYYHPAIQFKIKNKTNQPIYIDLGNTFYVCCGSPCCYYLPTSTTTSSSSTGGASVNMGSIASALGVGGAVGTLANGVNVGGAKTNGSSTTIYSQRVIAIPPTGTYSLDAQYLFPDKTEKGKWYSLGKGLYYRVWEQGHFVINTTKGDRDLIQYNVPITLNSDISEVKFQFLLTYSENENFSECCTMDSSFYLAQLTGTNYNYFGLNFKEWPQDIVLFPGEEIITKKDKSTFVFPE
ncbi:MAG: hypothetical protein LIP09_04140 [Bacteroidales bacterium]|nr:hypothetical protein [Bacteroidales bacterium]